MDDPFESDRAPGCAHARESYALTGHEEAERTVLSALEGGRLHHAWLITGPRGVGKATLAYRFIRRLMGAAASPDHGLFGAAPDDPVCRRIEAGAHSDVLTLRRPADSSGKSFKAVIPVEEARRAPKFFSQSSGEGGWRAVLVDSADELQTPQAANALLKTLEEPPRRGLLILISHSPGRLLPTIRSRCHRLDLRALTPEAAIEAARAQVDISDKDAPLLARMAEGAPGRAVALAQSDGAALFRELDALYEGLPRLDMSRAHRLSDSLAAKTAEPRRRLFYRLTRRFTEDQARMEAGAGGENLFAARAGRGGAKAWLDARSALETARREEESLYLDPKLGVLNALTRLRDAAR